MSAVRFMVQTIWPRWLIARCSQVTRPAVGRDLLSRLDEAAAFEVQRVADEDGGGQADLVEAEVGDQHAFGGVGHRRADQQR